MLRHVLRPEGISGTPKALAQELGVQTRKWPGFSGTPNFDTDLFLVYPDALAVKAADKTVYGALRSFFQMDKPHQRLALGAQGIPIPLTITNPTQFTEEEYEGQKWVVRPMRHSGGENYKITEDCLDFVPGQEYISALFPKKREYRVIFAFGQPIIWMRKKQNEGVSADLPWGHTNSVFQTINDVAGSLLAKTDCVSRLSALPVIQNAHLVAADILWNDGAYVVLELNTCPGLDIDNNRAKVVAAVKAHFIGDTSVDDIQASMVMPPQAPIPAPPLPPVVPSTPSAATNWWKTKAVVVKTYEIEWAGKTYTVTKEQVNGLIADLKALVA